MKAAYGITAEEYSSMLKAQNGACAICGQKETTVDPRTKKIYALSIDHDHKTGKVRDLLCRRCNAILGFLQDSRDLIPQFSKYLDKHDS